MSFRTGSRYRQSGMAVPVPLHGSRPLVPRACALFVRPQPYHTMNAKIRLSVCAGCFLVFLARISLFAQGQINVVGYDIQNAVTSGSFVQWYHNYYGSITITGTINVTLPPGDVTTATLANYSGGG